MLMPCWDKVCQLTQAPQNYLMPMHEYGVRYDKIHSGHDELIIECSQNVDYKSICGIMSRSPDWMPDIQIRGDGYETKFYKKD